MSVATEALTTPTIYDRPLIYEAPGWKERVRRVGKGVVDGTQFISKLREDVTERQRQGLAEHDRLGTIEAFATGYLADYDSDTPDEYGISDNSCLWLCKKAAVAAVHLPNHLAGTKFMVDEDVYEDFIIRKYEGEPDDELGLKMTLVRTVTMAQILQHMKERN